MARTTKKKEPVKETVIVATRAEKKDATKNLIREILAVKPLKHNELLDEVAKLYAEHYGDGSENVNDVKGRIGSVLDIMKKESDIMYDGGMYALKARMVMSEPRGEKSIKTEEEPAPKKRGRKPKAKIEEPKETEKTEEKAEPLPPAPLQPIAPTAPITPEVAPEPIPEDKPAPKKRGRKPKAKAEEVKPAEEAKPVEEVKAEEPAAVEGKKSVEAEEKKPVEEVKEEPKADEERKLVVKEKAEVVKPVMDMSFLFGGLKTPKTPVREEKKEEKKELVKTEAKPPVKVENKAVKKVEEKPVSIVKEKTEKPVKATPVSAPNVRKLPKATAVRVKKAVEKPLTADEKLREAFLKKLRALGGDYFEYYSVYLLERYSMKNGRRLEGMKISGGDHDGGIDGEIELTDKLGFKETIYIQSKNWNPEKGDEKLWVVGETLLQQFIGACACRQAKDGKQNCRGIFITTSRFTPEAKRILDDLSDKIVGYDGNDLFEAAKECEFGLIRKNGEWALDERLLSGSKAFFNLY